jgi:hypothetical protein
MKDLYLHGIYRPHAKKSFFSRVVGSIFARYHKERKFKHQAFRRAASGYKAFKRLIGFRHLWESKEYSLSEKRLVRKFIHIRGIFHSKIALKDRFPRYTRNLMQYKRLAIVVDEHYEDVIFSKSFVQMKECHSNESVESNEQESRDFMR